MTINARAKGQRGEREIVQLLQPVVNKVYEAHGLTGESVPVLERNLMQSMRGGYDIIGLEWFALEVKRHENTQPGSIQQWWTQTKSQAMASQEPVLFYRQNNRQWNVKMYGYLCVGANGGYRVRVPVLVDEAAFLCWFELRLQQELAAKGIHRVTPP